MASRLLPQRAARDPGRCYRYRTRALVGPWRDTPDEAFADALRARQARREEGGTKIVWVVDGDIEERS